MKKNNFSTIENIIKVAKKGGMFILVTIFLPKGIVGLMNKYRGANG